MSDPLQEALVRLGLAEFRPGQREIIEQVLAGRDCVVVMPTGAGKSLCFQLPAVLSDGLTLVISPLIALMKDQFEALCARGVSVSFINSSLEPAEQQSRLLAMSQGQYRVVYVAPERFRSVMFRRLIQQTRVCLLAVDEAHCISEWGHDFRPDYLRLGWFRQQLGNPPAIALTATATPHVREDICQQLRLRDPAVCVTGFDRPNLRFKVVYCSSQSDKHRQISTLLKRTEGSVILYASTRQRVESLGTYLRDELGVAAVDYHAGLVPLQRKAAQEAFMSGPARVVVATNAFGMGIDKPDIRAVLHESIPGSVEAYYQEAGRAGRDGQPAECLLCYDPEDIRVQEYFIDNACPPQDLVYEVYEFLDGLKDQVIELTAEQIRGEVNVPASLPAVRRAMQLLEQAELIERLRGWDKQALVRLPEDDQLELRAPLSNDRQRRVLSALVQLGKQAQVNEFLCSPQKLCESARLDPAKLGQVMRAITNKTAVVYVPPFRGTATRVAVRKLDAGKLAKQVDFERLGRLRAHELAKLQTMINYAESDRCYRNLILEYFGDQYEGVCGRCDNCLADSAQPAGLTAGSDQQAVVVIRKILSAVARLEQHRSGCGFGRSMVARVLAGSKSKKLSAWGLEALPTYGALREYALGDTAEMINQLLLAGCVRLHPVSEGGRPGVRVVRLTERGREVMLGRRQPNFRFELPGAGRGQPAPPTAEPIETGDSQATDDLYERLRQLRGKLAKGMGVRPYAIATNRSLEEMAERRPTTRQELLSIIGMGEYRVRQYGKALLGVIRAAAASEPEHLTKAEPTSPRAPLPAESPPARPTEQTLPESGVPTEVWSQRLAGKGFTVAEIAAIRAISEHTVREHLLADLER